MLHAGTNSDSSAVGALAEVGRSWGWLLAFGIITVLAGLAALLWPGPTIVVATVVFGIQLLVAGIFWLVNALASDTRGAASQVLLAVLAVVAGVVVLRSPARVASLLPLVLGLFWVVGGLIETFHALSARVVPSRGWAVAGGLLSVLAGIGVLAYPGLGLLAMTYVLGIWLVIYGGVAAVRAIRMRPHAIPAAKSRPAPA